jgi:hypothetical protein
MARDERVRNARQLAVMEVDVRATHLREQHVKESSPLLERWARERGNANRFVRRRDRGGEDGRRVGHVTAVREGT